MHEDEFDETLAPDEADTLAYKALWRKRRQPRLRARPTAAPAVAYPATATAWGTGRAKRAARATARQVARAGRKIDTLIQGRAKETRSLAKLGEALQRHKDNIAEVIKKREEYERQSAAVMKELVAFE